MGDFLVYHLLLILLTKMFMNMREVYTGIIPYTATPINKVEMVYCYIALVFHFILT